MKTNSELTQSQQITIPLMAQDREILQTPTKSEMYEELNRICSQCSFFDENGDSGIGVCTESDPRGVQWDSDCELFNQKQT